MILDNLNQLMLLYGAYILAVASPGPSNMAIMGVAMSRGRVQALALAAGVETGSMFWALLAASGLSALLATYANALFVIKIAGGFYLLYLAFRSARSALTPDRPIAESGGQVAPLSLGALYRRGVFLHLGNPKAVLGWIAIISLGAQPGAPAWTLYATVGGCAVLGIIIFGGYALLFSTAPMIQAYRKARRWIEGTLAVFFGYAGLRLLSSR